MNDLLSEDLLTPSIQPARKTKRWLACLIDYLFYFLIFTLITAFWGERYTTESGTVGYRATGLPALVCIAAWWVLLPVLEGLTGQTLGKAIFKIKTVKINGEKATVGNCIVRHLFDFIDSFPFFGITGLLVAGNNALKQRVGDLVAKTIVVKAEKNS
jgi:uncharacterized RDD family membrane protein YckC